MMHWTPAMWIIFFIASKFTFASYMTISIISNRKPGGLSLMNFLFIFFCGIDHAVMCLGMFDLHVTKWFDPVIVSWTIVGSSALVAAVSVPSAIMHFKLRHD